MRRILYRFAWLAFFISAVVGCSEHRSPEDRAIALVKESQALKAGVSVNDMIETLLNERENEIRPIGWEAKRVDNQRYLISYTYRIFSFERGVGHGGYFFDVDLNTGSVRNVTSKYEGDFKSLAPAFKDEKEIAEEFLEKLEKSKEDLSHQFK
jgi:hypothetical protein